MKQVLMIPLCLLLALTSIASIGCASQTPVDCNDFPTRAEMEEGANKPCLHNTANIKGDKTIAVFIPSDFRYTEPSKDEALIATATIVGYAVEGALKLAEYLITQEAKKYEAVYSGQDTTTLLSKPIGLAEQSNSEWVMNQGGLVLLVRTVPCEKPDKASMSHKGYIDDLVTELIVPQSNYLKMSRLLTKNEQGQDEWVDVAALSNHLKSEIEQQLKEAGFNKDHHIAFAGAFAIMPCPTDAAQTSTMRVALLGHYYAALKAKSTGRNGVAGLLKSKSITTLELKGPAADYRYAGGQYAASAVFPLSLKHCHQWNWTGVNPKKPSKFISQIVRVPASREITIKAGVRETNQIKKLLEDFAKQVGSAEIDVEAWFSDEDDAQ